MNNFRRQQLRGSFVTIITALLLVVSVAFSVIGYAASDGSKQQLEAIESRYTTIGTMKDQNTQLLLHGGSGWVYQEEPFPGNVIGWVDKNHTVLEDGSIIWDDGSMFYSSVALEEVANGASQIQTVARSAILSAHVTGIYGLTSATQNRLQYNEIFDKYSYGMAVVICRDESTDESVGGSAHIHNDRDNGFLLMPHSSFIASKVVSMHPEYARYFKGDAILLTGADFIGILSDPHEVEFLNDKQYIMRCFICTQPVVQVPKKEAGQVTYTYMLRHHWEGKYGTTEAGQTLRDISRYKEMEFTTHDLFQFQGIQAQEGVGQKNFTLDLKTYKSETIKLGEDGYGHLIEVDGFYYAVPDDSLPFYAEFEGELEDFLNSEEGQVWRDVIIPMAEINQQSATVMLVDDLHYLHAFNSGKAMVVEGRAIDPVEFVKGENVCVVSVSYAQNAGLEVGDTIELDYYDTGYFLTSAKIENWDATVSEFAMAHNPLQESNRIGYKQEYTVVGLYAAPEYELGTTNFYADTIFVPKASVPNAEEYEDPGLPLLNSVVLMNGTIEEFEKYMRSQGFGGYYEYAEQDYSATAAGLRALSQNALRLLILAGAVFFVTAILFYYLNFKRMIPVAYGMRRMGQHPLKLWWQMEMVTLPIILIAVFGGAYLGVYFFEYVTMELFETNIIMDIETVKWLTLLETAVLCAISLLVAIPISVPRLMKRK